MRKKIIIKACGFIFLWISTTGLAMRDKEKNKIVGTKREKIVDLVSVATYLKQSEEELEDYIPGNNAIFPFFDDNDTFNVNNTISESIFTIKALKENRS